MKKYLLIPLLGALLTSPLAAEEKAPSNQKMIEQILTDYQNGRYNSFLKEMDSTYKDANKKWEYNSFLEKRKKLSSIVVDYEAGKTKDFKIKIANLHKIQDKELMELCQSYPNEQISQEVRDMILFVPSKDEQESLDFIHDLGSKFKGDGATPLENKLIRIDIEYWLKSRSLDVVLTQNKVDAQTFEKQNFVLQMEKMNQMKEACQGDLADVRLKKYVYTAADVLPKVHLSTSTRKHLTALQNGKATPTNQIEQKMKEIMVKYSAKEDAIIKEFFPNS